MFCKAKANQCGHSCTAWLTFAPVFVPSGCYTMRFCLQHGLKSGLPVSSCDIPLLHLFKLLEEALHRASRATLINSPLTRVWLAYRFFLLTSLPLLKMVLHDYISVTEHIDINRLRCKSALIVLPLNGVGHATFPAALCLHNTTDTYNRF